MICPNCHFVFTKDELSPKDRFNIDTHARRRHLHVTVMCPRCLVYLQHGHDFTMPRKGSWGWIKRDGTAISPWDGQEKAT